MFGFCTTYAKLHPAMKPYEYGFPAFLIMCCFIMVSGYGKREFIETAVTPFLLIALAAAVSFVVNISIYPIWAGLDPHNVVVKHFLSIANSLEGRVNSYIQRVEHDGIPSKILTFQASDDPINSGYQSAMKSISQEDALAPLQERLIFQKELQRVGTESANVLRLLGSKVQKMEKLGPGDICVKCMRPQRSCKIWWTRNLTYSILKTGN